MHISEVETGETSMRCRARDARADGAWRRRITAHDEIERMFPRSYRPARWAGWAGIAYRVL